MTEFEMQLSQQPLCNPPPSWKQEILRAAATGQEMESNRTSQPISRGNWLELFWPPPKAWAGLAAIWVVTIGLQLHTEQMAAASDRGRTRLDPRRVSAFLEHQRIAMRAIESDRDPAEPLDRPKPIPNRSDKQSSRSRSA